MLDNFKGKQKQKIIDNYLAYCNYFSEPFISYVSGWGFYIFTNETDLKCFQNWVCFCPSVDFLDGWLWGCVQTVCREEIKESIKK